MLLGLPADLITSLLLPRPPPCRHRPPPPSLALALAAARSYEDDYEQETPRVRGIVHQPTRPVDKDKTEVELALHVKKAVSAEETAPKQKHVRSACLPSLALAARLRPRLASRAQR